jgi:hypothetical protein
VFREFVLLCRQLELFGRELLAVGHHKPRCCCENLDFRRACTRCYGNKGKQVYKMGSGHRRKEACWQIKAHAMRETLMVGSLAAAAITSRQSRNLPFDAFDQIDKTGTQAKGPRRRSLGGG